MQVNAKYCSFSLRKVENVTSWRMGLHVLLLGYGVYGVVAIESAHSNRPNDTFVANLSGEDYILFYYSGKQISVDPMEISDLYKIVLRKITMGKVGGHRCESDLLEFPDCDKNLSVDGVPPSGDPDRDDIGITN